VLKTGATSVIIKPSPWTKTMTEKISIIFYQPNALKNAESSCFKGDVHDFERSTINILNSK